MRYFLSIFEWQARTAFSAFRRKSFIGLPVPGEQQSGYFPGFFIRNSGFPFCAAAGSIVL